MIMLRRLMRDARYDPTPLGIDLDPEEIERKKAQRRYYLNVVQIPTLRILGFSLLAICILLHNLLLLKTFSLDEFHSYRLHRHILLCEFLAISLLFL